MYEAIQGDIEVSLAKEVGHSTYIPAPLRLTSWKACPTGGSERKSFAHYREQQKEWCEHRPRHNGPHGLWGVEELESLEVEVRAVGSGHEEVQYDAVTLFHRVGCRLLHVGQ